jgi:zinc/manganese transport system permease protein
MSNYGVNLGILLPALLAGLLLLVSHVPLGQQVLARGIIFIDLAIAQIAVLGVIAAHALGLGHATWGVQVAALGAALLGAAFLYYTDRRWPARQEAIIGSSFVLAASLGILLLARDPLAGEHLKDLLVGQILWATPADLLPLAILTAVFVPLWRWPGLRHKPLAFYTLFATLITASVQLVGVYLVFASLILPALASPRRVAPAWLIGAAGYLLGLLASAVWDLPSGAAIVCAIALCAVAGGAWLARRRPDEQGEPKS